NRDYYSFYASCSAEALLKECGISATLPKRFEMLVFGKIPWSSQQKTITNATTISITESMAKFYQQLCQCFPREQLFFSGKVHYNYFREIISNNLIAGVPWWSDFLEQVAQFDSETHYFFLRRLFQEGKGLRQMIEKIQLSNEQQILLVKVCHQALQYIYAQIYAKTSEGEYPRIQRENEDILRKLENCQSPSQFREFMVRFWVKAGHPKLLQQHWEELMPVTTGQADWKLCQDLVFLAIASYPISQQQEAQSQETNDSSTES
ncbi:MAG: CRISPR-associated protein Cas8a1/Csx13, partial [Halothece sp. Uz-M2-17]|nr:CRISPR-associated protein Cas8a1/Csx13 [Halothece sp. Uz-M2-17]